MSDSSMQNLRDVGGVPVAGGGHVRRGVLYRGDAPWAGDAATALGPWPPRTVIDLRSAGELAPEHPLAATGAEVHHRPLTAELTVAEIADGAPALQGGLHEVYRRTLDGAGAVVAEVAGVVADAPAPILVHCAAGKDRTGIVIAAVLSAVGVAREDVVADYVATEANMEGVVARMGAAGQPGAAVVEQLRVSHPEAFMAPARAIETVLDHLEAAGGGAAWLQAQGLAPAVVERLHDRLVEAA
jgi:protein-tyrosine phosphatase